MTVRPRGNAAGLRRGSADGRLRIAFLLIAILLSVFAARLFQLQGIDPQAYAARAQADGLVHVTLPAARGNIVDRNGEVLAQSVAGTMIVADPTLTAPHAQQIAQMLAQKLNLDYFSILQKLSTDKTPNGTSIRFTYIARRVPATDANALLKQVSDAKLTGLYGQADPLRDYPGGDLAANLLGFMNGEGQPSGGLEAAFSKMLAGRDGSDTYAAGDGARIPLGENTQVNPVNGQTLKLTIDRDVQWYAQRTVQQAVQTNGAASGVAIVMDTQSGQLLALADYPSFDANHPGDGGALGSAALSNVYEPGSVEKTLTNSAMIEKGVITPQTQITVPPYLPVADRVIHDFETHGTIHLTAAGVLAQSSNIGTVLESQHIDAATLGSYLKSFGLGQATGIGIPGESAGILPSPSSWNELTKSNISFGQGLGVNALQIATAVNTIANHGLYVSPSIVVGKATTTGGKTVGSDVSSTHQVVSANTAQQVTSMMELVPTKDGTAPNTAIGGYRVAGKTGTAEEVNPACKCYDFVDVSYGGFAPADAPRFTVYVVIKDPKTSNPSGAMIAGPVWREIMTYLLQKYAVPPTGTPAPGLAATW